ncbi:hypothetical protein JOE49_004887 [Paenibacillus sp. PvR133]|uniref:hypothetical protein n=1 Tax=Paenibacillus sp. PvR133 TaxID=2806598 RepID=UPI001AE82C10|nr:hypothetical protein [Paenibacillus sp. PvR133]MBP1177635.1 hypothetical protein [Paenibacillus sp. PvR133]
MLNRKKNVSSNELIEIIRKSCMKMSDIKSKLDTDDLINQGLFLMATTYFEATLRDVMHQILIINPGKLKKDKFTINKNVLCNSDDHKIINDVIENELFNLFKGNVKEQLLYIIEIVSNIKYANIKNKPQNENIMTVITKCSDISIYRNSLIHNAGISSKDFPEKVDIYKYDINQELLIEKELIIKFINDYLDFFDILAERILKNVDFKQKARIEQLRDLWNQCFDSPILKFDEYWIIDEERDLIVDVKYPKYEGSISSSEKVYLSIWRHQFYDAIPTHEFLLCSVNEDIIYKIYKGLEKVKFYYMHQQAHR